MEKRKSQYGYLTLEMPEYTSVRVREKDNQQLIIDIPPGLFFDRYNQRLILLTIGWFSLVLFLLFATVSSTNILGSIFLTLYIVFFVYKLIIVILEVDYLLIEKQTDTVTKNTSQTKSVLGSLILPSMVIGLCLLCIWIVCFFSNQGQVNLVLFISLFLLVFDVLVDVFSNNIKFHLLKNIVFTTKLTITKKEKNRAEISNDSLLKFFKISAISISQQKFGYLLTQVEKYWLIAEINNFLKQTRQDKT